MYWLASIILFLQRTHFMFRESGQEMTKWWDRQLAYARGQGAYATPLINGYSVAAISLSKIISWRIILMCCGFLLIFLVLPSSASGIQ
jgi:hypothetical protein